MTENTELTPAALLFGKACAHLVIAAGAFVGWYATSSILSFFGVN